MNTCKTCKHWEGDVTQDEPFDCGTYLPLENLPHRVRFCYGPHLKFSEAPDKAGAAVYDGEDYRSYLLTGEDFGCNGWAQAD